MGIMTSLVRTRAHPVIGRLTRQLALVLGCDIPAQVRIGEGLRLEHRGRGVVVHAQTDLGDRVTIYHNVTTGRSWDGSGTTYIEDDVVLSTGCVVLSGSTDRRIGTGAVIGANAVVTTDVPAWEVWGGIPARRLRSRRPGSRWGEPRDQSV